MSEQSSPEIMTAVTILEHLPRASQKIAVEKLREFVYETESSRKWDELLEEHPEVAIKMAEEAIENDKDGRVWSI